MLICALYFNKSYGLYGTTQLLLIYKLNIKKSFSIYQKYSLTVKFFLYVNELFRLRYNGNPFELLL